jgi:hypothetical protein
VTRASEQASLDLPLAPIAPAATRCAVAVLALALALETGAPQAQVRADARGACQCLAVTFEEHSANEASLTVYAWAYQIGRGWATRDELLAMEARCLAWAAEVEVTEPGTGGGGDG